MTKVDYSALPEEPPTGTSAEAWAALRKGKVEQYWAIRAHEGRIKRENAWFQRLHDTIRAAVEEGTLAALQRHDERFRRPPSGVEYNIENK